MSKELRSRIVGHDRVEASTLLANPFNHRRHSKKQQAVVSASLDELGIVKSIIVNRTTGHLVDGHDRLRDAMARSPSTLVDVEYIELSAVEEKKALAMLDAMVALGKVDNEALDDLLAEALTITDAKPMADWLSSLKTQVDAFADSVPPAPPKEPITKLGDLWKLGQHRLLCGDCTDAETVKRLCRDTYYDLTFTDPPYGVDWDYGGAIKDSQEGLKKLIDGFFPLCKAMSEVVALTPGIANQRLYPEPAWTLCWFYCTGTGRSCWGFSAWQPIMVWGDDPQLANGNGCHPDAFKMDGYEYLATTDDRKEEKLLDHTCPKPLSVWRRFMQRLTFDAKSVYDPFGGSGTTLIAADQLGLQCDTMELSPAYCDVIVERWKRHTGGEPVLERK